MESDLGNKAIFADNLKAYMETRGLTATKLSDELNIPVTTISNWLRAVAYPRIDKIEMLAKYFNCQKADLVEAPKEYTFVPEEPEPIQPRVKFRPHFKVDSEGNRYMDEATKEALRIERSPEAKTKKAAFNQVLEIMETLNDVQLRRIAEYAQKLLELRKIRSESESED